MTVTDSLSKNCKRLVWERWASRGGAGLNRVGSGRSLPGEGSCLEGHETLRLGRRAGIPSAHFTDEARGAEKLSDWPREPEVF